MKYTVKNVTLDIETCDDEDFTGSCCFYIPFKHKAFIKDCCGMEKSPLYNGKDDFEPIFTHNYGEFFLDIDNKCYHCTSADLLIAYLSWLLSEDGNFIVKVEYSNPFWAIHDMEHAQNDESGCTIYVDKHIEYDRLKDALYLFVKEGYTVTYELIQEIEEAYNGRFGTSVSFEEYLYEEEYEEEYETSDN